MIFRARVSVAGGHVHLACFSSQSLDHTFAKLGDLCVTRGREFVALEAIMGEWEMVTEEGQLWEARTNVG